MRIWKCDMCGAILENGEDVIGIMCKEGYDKDFYPNSYEVCRECARNVNKFIKKEWKPGLFASLKMMYDYCKSQGNCGDCLLNEKRFDHGMKCMVGTPVDNWALNYPCLEEDKENE